MNEETRAEILAVISDLMLSDNLGDVHEATDKLRRAVGLPDLKGNYLDGWAKADWKGLE